MASACCDNHPARLFLCLGESMCNMQDGEDLFDGSHIAGPSRGRIEGSGIGGAGIGTILQVSLSSTAVICMIPA